MENKQNTSCLKEENILNRKTENKPGIFLVSRK
jgi:hypothetical protein